MPVLNFTLEYDDLVNDVDDTAGDVGTTPGVGPMYFTTLFPRGARIPVADFSPRPSGIGLRTFTGYLDTDGRLKNEAGGTAGLRLWANDPDFNLDRFQYRVSAELTDQLGRPVDFHGFNFDAPSEDVIRYLTDEMPKPGQKFGRGRPGFGIGELDVVDGELVITREDGVELDPIIVPESNALSAAYTLTFGR